MTYSIHTQLYSNMNINSYFPNYIYSKYKNVMVLQDKSPTNIDLAI